MQTLESEFEAADLGDKRLNARLVSFAKSIEAKHGGAVSYSCGDWKSAKAAYRFLDNERFSENDIIEPHLSQTAARVRAKKASECSSSMTQPGLTILGVDLELIRFEGHA